MARMSVVVVAKDFKLFRRLKKKYMNSFLELQDIQNLNSGKIIKGHPINVIILITKSYIFSCAFMKRSLNLAHLKIKIKSVYEYEYFIYKEKEQEKDFKNTWKKFSKLFD